MATTELTTIDDLRDACGADALVVWSAQDFAPGVRAWAHDGAVVVASPELSRRDRLVVHGPPFAAIRLVRTILSDVGESFRPITSPEIMAALSQQIASVRPVAEFAWMQTFTPPPPDPSWIEPSAAWLDPSTWDDVAALLHVAFPDSLAQPGVAGVRRWAGIRRDGVLLATAADAWSCQDVGFVSGIASHPRVRCHGLGRAVCKFVFRSLLREHPALGLFVADSNTPAIGLYRSLGLALSPVAVARIGPA